MNLFRSEEHARRWSEFDSEFASNLRPVAVWAERFAGEMFRRRLDPDYITWYTAWRAAQSR